METAFPGEYGVGQPWYFPVTKAYWTGKPPQQLEYQGKGTSIDLDLWLLSNSTWILADTADAKFIETFAGHEQPGIEIEGLCKVFKVKAVCI